MIYSMITKTIKSMITTVINPFDGLLSRYFVTLDPVLNSHHELAAPITFSGDFEVEVDFSITSETGCLISGTFAGENSFNIIIRNGLVRAFIYVGTTVSDNLLPTDYISDGKLNTVKVTYNGTTASIFINGALGDSTTWSTNGSQDIKFFSGRAGAFDYFDGIIANAKFTDKSGASDVVTTFKLDKATANTEYPQENVFGSEEVTNGDFATDSDWAAGNDGTLNITNGQGYLTGSGRGRFGQQLNTVIGKSYNIKLNVTSLTNADGVNIVTTPNSTLTAETTVASVGLGSVNIVWTAITTNSHFGFIQNNASETNWEVVIDNVSVKEITNAVTYINIPQSARDLYTLDGTTWTDAAGNTIEVAS